ncbi:single-stranded DNA-binding protein [Oceanospirillum multiglobuliferum]|jgi:single-strand DNA-binding protein|uniref:Single-stranded DNA-binding protein n=1 Tax=Oceanospirillum multiglobuliferum TaxID=64969 RepID=A0A1V4T0C7_9GAMM|nr:single-stranded DNA-binding protein [Oceanospirillum multiglobuliferum]OPX54052.1 single-stranded DNA-binding protein [Oceanospirillum multiglobuliferum]
MINNVVLQGKLGKDIDLKYTQSGKAVGSVSIASTRDFKDANGNRETDWINLVFWGKTAETVANYFKKGDEILVVGRLQVRNYEDQQGNKKYITEIVVSNFSFPGGKSKGSPQNNSSGNSYSNNRNSKPNADPFSGSSIDIGEDDLPF